MKKKLVVYVNESGYIALSAKELDEENIRLCDDGMNALGLPSRSEMDAMSDEDTVIARVTLNVEKIELGTERVRVSFLKFPENRVSFLKFPEKKNKKESNDDAD